MSFLPLAAVHYHRYPEHAVTSVRVHLPMVGFRRLLHGGKAQSVAPAVFLCRYVFPNAVLPPLPAVRVRDRYHKDFLLIRGVQRDITISLLNFHARLQRVVQQVSEHDGKVSALEGQFRGQEHTGFKVMPSTRAMPHLWFTRLSTMALPVRETSSARHSGVPRSIPRTYSSACFVSSPCSIPSRLDIWFFMSCLSRLISASYASRSCACLFKRSSSCS